MSTNDTDPSSEIEAKQSSAWPRFLLLVVLPFTVVLSGGYFYLTSGRIISTENASIKAHKIAVSADVSGRVVAVEARENSPVDIGQMLFRLDPKPFHIALARAEAELGVVVHEIESYRTAYHQELAELKLAEDNLAFAERDYQRQQALSQRGILSQSAYDAAQHAVQTARQRMATINADITHALSNLGGSPALLTESHPRYLQAQAARDQAQLDLERTTIKASVAGIVSHLGLEVGEYVEAGDPVFSVIATDPLWVTANLKETQLTYVREGQAAVIYVDMYPERQWQAVIDSISPATGAEFSLLPPQNASGNWVKVVQRIPVRLTLLDHIPEAPLRAGMSVTVDIDTERSRELPGAVKTALVWLKRNPRTAETSQAPTADGSVPLFTE